MTPRTPAQIEASRRNGAKSRGPVSPQGKARSSTNSLQHGFRASRETAVEIGNRQLYERLRRAYLNEYRPVGPTENTLVDHLIHAAWQVYRVREIEIEEPITLGASGSFGKSEKLARYRASFERALHKSITQLRIMQTERCLREADRTLHAPAHLPPVVCSRDCVPLPPPAPRHHVAAAGHVHQVPPADSPSSGVHSSQHPSYTGDSPQDAT